jgi:hypothetical protein
MDSDPNQRPAQTHYTWPKYLIAALAAFLFVCVVWTLKEVERLKRIKKESQNSPPPTLRADTNQSTLTTTNSAR